MDKKELKAKFLKIKLAAVGVNFTDPEQRRNQINKSKNTKAFEEGRTAAPLEQNQRRLDQERDNINKGTKITPTGTDSKMNLGLKKKLAKIRQANIDHEHGHTIIMKGHTKGLYRSASLQSQQGHYAKYWLLNAKATNGNGWGIASHSAKANMHKFIGKPLVITSAKWRGSKIKDKYGDTFDHPYIPTNDLNKIYEHQEQYRVGNIVDIGEKDGDYFAMIEMLPKFANMKLPPFCSPAIFQLDAREEEGQISKWEALHLAALDTDPAYGAMIALLKGTCVGSNNECRIQFKSAKQKKPSAFSQERQQQVHEEERELAFTHSTERAEAKHKAEIKKILGARVKRKLAKVNEFGQTEEEVENQHSIIQRKKIKKKLARVEKGNTTFDTLEPEEFTDIDDIIKNVQPIPGTAGTGTRRTRKQRLQRKKFVKGQIGNRNAKFVGRPGESKIKLIKRKAGEVFSGDIIMNESEKVQIKKQNEAKLVCPVKLKERLSKLKKKLRTAKSSVEDILRGVDSSVDGSHADSSFLSTKGDFIGGGGQKNKGFGITGEKSHIEQIDKILKTSTTLESTDRVISEFSSKHNLPKVQNFPINKAGERRLSFGINSKINRTQLKTIKDSEVGGRTIGFSVGPHGKETTGSGFKDLTKALQRHKLV